MSNIKDGTIRTPKRIGYTVVPNGVLPEGKISARAWGLYVYLLSRPPGWEIRTPQLQKVFSEGRDAIYTALRELVDADLMHLESYRTPEGLPRKRYVMIAPEKILESPNTGFQDTGNQDTEKPWVTTTDINQSDDKSLRNPFTSEQSSDGMLHVQSSITPTETKPIDALNDQDRLKARYLIIKIALHVRARGSFWDDIAQDAWQDLMDLIENRLLMGGWDPDMDLMDTWTISGTPSTPYEAGAELNKILHHLYQ